MFACTRPNKPQSRQNLPLSGQNDCTTHRFLPIIGRRQTLPIVWPDRDAVYLRCRMSAKLWPLTNQVVSNTGIPQIIDCKRLTDKYLRIWQPTHGMDHSRSVPLGWWPACIG